MPLSVGRAILSMMARSHIYRLAAGVLLSAVCMQAGPLAAQRAVHVPVRIAPVVPGLGTAAQAGALHIQPQLLLGPSLPSLASPGSLPLTRTAVPRVSPSLRPAAVRDPKARQISHPALPGSQDKDVEGSRPLRLLIAGAPGSGKTTLGKRLAQETGIVHISVGALLRESAESHPELAPIMEQGELVDSELVLDLVRRRLSQEDVRRRGFVLDGFPRRMLEAAALEEWLAEGPGLDAMIRLEVPESELRRRILARGRKDDTEETFRNRMLIYHEQTEPVIEHFKAGLDMLRPDVAGADIEENYRHLKRSLDDWRARR